MNVAITGARGFLGRHVMAAVAASGHTPLPVPHSVYDLTRQHDAMAMYDDLEPDAVIHLAAKVGGIQANQEHPGQFFYTNAIMGLNVIEQARLHDVHKFVQVGTVCSYPAYPLPPFMECDLFSGYPDITNAPYGIAKRALLVMLKAYQDEYGLNGIYLLPANLYGPGDNFDESASHVIPALIRRFIEAKEAKAKSVTVWGSGGATREFLFVRDAADGIVRAMLHYDEPGPVNLGTGQEMTIRHLAVHVAEATGFTGRIEWDMSKPDGQARRCLDTTKAREKFGWRATTNFADGLAETVAWYKANRHAL